MNKRDKQRLAASMKNNEVHIIAPVGMGKIEVFYSKHVSKDHIIVMNQRKSYLFEMAEHDRQSPDAASKAPSDAVCLA